jgi:hypothetical protein
VASFHSSRAVAGCNHDIDEKKDPEFSTQVMSGCVFQQALLIIEPTEHVANLTINDSSGMGQNV